MGLPLLYDYFRIFIFYLKLTIGFRRWRLTFLRQRKVSQRKATPVVVRLFAFANFYGQFVNLPATQASNTTN
ncbi:hypothetical protein A1D24_09490 [Testudinibacter aquarius]|nr:hypothetical protein A1D24_09490 [Testudinibacter aquarius]